MSALSLASSKAQVGDVVCGEVSGDGSHWAPAKPRDTIAAVTVCAAKNVYRTNAA